MYSTEGISHSRSYSDLTPQLPCLGQIPYEGEETDKEKEEKEKAGTMTAISADFYSEELEMEDLKAFEQRMEELSVCNKPRPVRWPLVWGTIFACTAISACHWLEDVRESDSILLRMISSRGALALSLATIVVMIFYGVKESHQPYPNESVQHTRDALSLFQLHCDDDGRLICVAPMNRDSAHRTLPHAR